MKNTIIHLFGFPGAGKYTIAKEICSQADIKLVDNHLINIPLFSLIQQDGILPVNPRIWENVGKVWDAVLDTMIHISPPKYNFVLTNALTNEGKEDKNWALKVNKAATERGGLYIPVRILISEEENKRRITQPDRAKRMKEINPESPAKNAKNRTVLETNLPNELTLNVTKLTAAEAAEIILDHARNCAKA